MDRYDVHGAPHQPEHQDPPRHLPLYQPERGPALRRPQGPREPGGQLREMRLRGRMALAGPVHRKGSALRDHGAGGGPGDHEASGEGAGVRMKSAEEEFEDAVVSVLKSWKAYVDALAAVEIAYQDALAQWREQA